MRDGPRPPSRIFYRASRTAKRRVKIVSPLQFFYYLNMARDQTPLTHGASRFKPLFACAAAIAALGWFWTVGTFLLSVHMVYEYIVTSSIEGLTECFKPLLTIVHPELFWVAIPAIGVGVSAYVVFIHGKTPLRSTILYCLGFLVTPGLEFIRQSAWPVPHTFLEPFLFAILTGMLMKELLQIKLPPAQTFFNPAKHGWFVLVVLASIALASWWFWQSHRAYEDYQLGYFDFGHFARRVINTWRGVGFLQQTPGLPPFWDHFNPALATLAPLWGLWSDAHLFFALQAVSLAVGSLFVYGIARRLGTSSAGSAAWAGAYLCYPVVGQLNLNFSYGWHPVTIAIPLILAAFYALTCRRPVVALLLAAFACSWKEERPDNRFFPLFRVGAAFLAGTQASYSNRNITR